ncbi:MAG: SEC-C metal-binding domain-containing protein [Acidobacteriota bacterium]
MPATKKVGRNDPCPCGSPQQFPQQRPPTTLKPHAESRLCPHLSYQ